MTTPQTTSLKTSKKLKELGVPQESIYWWLYGGNGYHPLAPDYKKTWYLGDTISLNNNHDGVIRGQPPVFSDRISAYLSDEIGRWLPSVVKKGSENYGLAIHKSKYKDSWYVYYELFSLDKWFYIHKEDDDNLNEAMAKMLIYLIENGYVDVKSLKKISDSPEVKEKK